MKQTEFDRFADEYHTTHAKNIAASGEAPEFFAEYKIADTARLCREACVAPARILDFGCGVGNSIPHFASYFPKSRIIGADVSRKSLEIARERFSQLAEFIALEDSQTR